MRRKTWGNDLFKVYPIATLFHSCSTPHNFWPGVVRRSGDEMKIYMSGNYCIWNYTSKAHFSILCTSIFDMRCFSQILFWPCALRLISVFFFIANTSATSIHVPRATCTITPSLNGSDDAPAILSAFKKCGKDGTIVFQNHTYTINSIMNTTGLSNVNIEIHGTLLVPQISVSSVF